MRRVRVVKLGGSLLTLPSLREKFLRWCYDHPHPLSLIVVGGGTVVDAVRAIDQANPIEDEFAHWLCIDLMRHTARLAHQILGNVLLCETEDAVQRLMAESENDPSARALAIVQVACFLGKDCNLMNIPTSWDVTSDSLAAAFCQLQAAEELVVMKSTDVREDFGNLVSLAEKGIVDRHFPEMAKALRVRFVNLKSY